MELTDFLAGGEHAICQHCDTKYERYNIFFKKDEMTIGKHKFLRETKGLDKLCKDCYVEEMEPFLEFALH